MPAIELTKEARKEAIASLQRYFDESFDPIGELPAGLLLNYLLEEIGPAIYNQAVADAQARITQRLSDLTGELFVDEFTYWPKQEARRKGKR